MKKKHSNGRQVFLVSVSIKRVILFSLALYLASATSSAQSLQTLENYADLKDSMNLTKSVAGLGNFAFSNATTIQSINLFGNITAIDSIFTSKKILKELKGKTKTEINEYLEQNKSDKLTYWLALLDVGAKLYGLQKKIDVNRDSVGLALLIPENSTWGTQLYISSIVKKFRSSKDKQADLAFALGIKFDYASKGLVLTDTVDKEEKSFSLGQFLMRPGVEVAYKEILSIYWNWNCNVMTTGVNDFNLLFNNPNQLTYRYADFGLRGRFKLIANKGSAIDIDLNFVRLTDGVRKLYDTPDRVVPIIRLGFFQSLILK